MLNDRSSLAAFLKSRKSASAKAMDGPGPTAAQLSDILRMASRIPDHGKLAPWRFVVFEGAARARLGDRMAARWQELHPDHGEGTVGFVRAMPMRAPTVVMVVSAAREHPKVPVWEQELSAGAVCYNMLLAAQALGFDAQWQTDWLCYDDAMRGVMGVAAEEKVAGLIYIGTATEPLEDRPRPDAAALTTRWEG
jgi:nitroreductase